MSNSYCIKDSKLTSKIYLLVKENQGHLLNVIQETFEQTHQAISHTILEKSHDRIEKRTCKVRNDIDWISKKMRWKNFNLLYEKKAKERTYKQVK